MANAAAEAQIAFRFRRGEPGGGRAGMDLSVSPTFSSMVISVRARGHVWHLLKRRTRDRSLFDCGHTGRVHDPAVGTAEQQEPNLVSHFGIGPGRGNSSDGEKLDPAIGQLIENSHRFQIGIRYDRQFELEYVVNANPSPVATDISSSRIPGDSARLVRWSFSPRAAMAQTGGLRGIVRVSKSRYDKWLGEFAEH